MTSFLQGPLTNSVFTDTVTYCEVENRNNAGDPVWGVKKVVSARVEKQRTRIKRPGGDDIIAKHKIVTLVEIPENALVWLDEDTSPSKGLQPIEVKSSSAPSGFSIYETSL